MNKKETIYINCTGHPYPENKEDEKTAIQFSWAIEGTGFGTTTFYYKNGKLRCDNEGMSKDNIKKILSSFVDMAEFDD